MSEPRSVVAVAGDPREHPAARAWAAVAPGAATPSAVGTLQESRKSGVYRLDGVGWRGAPVVAKRCRRATGRVERIVYQDVLPQLPVSALRCHGYLEDGDAAWLFLEAAGGARFSIVLDAHRALASHWLAVVHGGAATLDAIAALPERDAAYHRRLLRAIRDALRAHIANPALRPGDVALVDAILLQCDALEARWEHVDAWCAAVPPTLVHGDFRAKNVRVRSGDGTGDGELAVMDWETAGRGAPATDLASTRALALDVVDVGAYRDAAGACWPWLDDRMVRRLIAAGRIFRRLTAISWDMSGLATDWPQRAVACLRAYRAELDDDIGVLDALR